VTLEELEDNLPNGFHDAEVFSLELDYALAVAKFHLNLLVGWPDDRESERQAYQEATLLVTGLCFCSIDAPSPTYPFLPDGKPICVSGDAAKPDHLPSLPDLTAKLPGALGAIDSLLMVGMRLSILQGAMLRWYGSVTNRSLRYREWSFLLLSG
jgi:hypothetical protein